MHSSRFFFLPVIVLAFGPLVEAQVIESIDRASLAPGSNAQGESYSYDPEIDGNGRFVIFTSTADNFAAPGNTPGQLHEHVYLRDTLTNVTTQLDITSDGMTGTPGASFNPGIRTFGSSFDPHISRDGKYVVFLSPASNISPDGAGESFGSWAYLKNLETGAIQRIPFATAGDNTRGEFPAYLAINADGSTVVILSIISSVTDLNCESCRWELTVYDRNSNTTTLINTGVEGNKFNPGISDDGRYVVFENQTGDFFGPTRSYLYDLTVSQLTPLNNGNLALSPAISGDGLIIAYSDNSSVPTQIKLLERISGIETTITGPSGELPNGISEFASLSIDGRYLAFLSTADNLVARDGNGRDDIFVYDRVSAKTTLVSVQGSCSGVSTIEDFNTGPPSISSAGDVIAFTVLERLVTADKADPGGNVFQPADTTRFDDVYVSRVNLSAAPDIFKPGLTPNAPLVSVNCTGEEARVQVDEVLAKVATAAKPRKGSIIKKITQQILLKKLDAGSKSRETIRQLTSKRNEFTFTTLPPGNYSVRTQARATYKGGKTAVTRSSPSIKFTIEK